MVELNTELMQRQPKDNEYHKFFQNVLAIIINVLMPFSDQRTILYNYVFISGKKNFDRFFFLIKQIIIIKKWLNKNLSCF